MKHLPLDFLREVIRPRTQFSISPIKDGFGPAEVYRVSLDPGRSHPWGRSLVVKYIKPDWPDGTYGPERELRFYAELLPKLTIPHPELLYAGVDDRTRFRVLILQDIADTHAFPPPQHTWSLEELSSIIKAYAELHVAGTEVLPAVEDRDWMFTYHKPAWTAGDLENMLAALVDRKIWAPIPDFGSFAEYVINAAADHRDAPVTLLHHEAYPPNIGLPRSDRLPANLIDWDFVGWGLAEIELAYLFLQPYRSARLLNRGRIIDLYWAERAKLEGKTPPAEVRRARQQYADGLLALAELSVAYRVARNPFPTGSAQADYWRVMYPVLWERLAEFAREAP